MVWSRVLIAAGAAVALLAGDTRAQVCPDGQFSVSVLDDPQVQCLAARPCSGVYGPQGLMGGVGACPSGTGCALLPHNPSVMGCVVAGRADVSYVNPDGSLTRGGVVIAGPPNADTSANNNNAASGGYTDPNNANNNANANNNGANANNNANNNGANANANGNSTVATTATPGANTNVPTPAHVKPGDASTEDSKAPSPAAASAAPAAATSTAPASSGKPGDANAAASNADAATETPTPTPTETPTPTPTPSSTPASSTNQQKALDNIEGGIASNRDGTSASGGVGITSIIAIVMGCLAVVAVIAGVFVLRKKKEQALETPAGGALDDYMGAGGVTPKENVLLL